MSFGMSANDVQVSLLIEGLGVSLPCVSFIAAKPELKVLLTFFPMLAKPFITLLSFSNFGFDADDVAADVEAAFWSSPSPSSSMDACEDSVDVDVIADE